MRVAMDYVDPSKMDGFDNPEPGSYHFEVLNVEEEDSKSGCMYADCEVLSGTTPDQEGKTHREYFSLKSTAMSRIVQFAVAIGLLSKEDIERHKADGTEPDLPFATEAPGRQFCGKLEADTYEGKTRNKLNFNMWPLDSKSAKGIPLNEARLRKSEPEHLAINTGESAQGADANANAGNANPAPTVTADDLDGLL